MRRPLRHGRVHLRTFVGLGRFQACLGLFQVIYLEPEMVQPNEVDPFRLVGGVVALVAIFASVFAVRYSRPRRL